MISTTEIHWLAGLLEGEATFGMWKYNGRGQSAFLSLKMTDRDIVERAARLLETRSILTDKKQQEHHKQAYSTRSHGIKAIGWMMTLYPLLGDRRRARIREIVASWRQIPCARKFRQQCPLGHSYTKNKYGGRRCVPCAVASNAKRKLGRRTLHDHRQGVLA